MTLDVRELLIRLRRGQSARAVARELGVARATVQRYQRIARADGLLDAADLPGTAELDRLLAARRGSSQLPDPVFQAAPLRPVIEHLRRRGVEAKAIHQRLCDEHGYEGSYSSVYRFIKS
jgi:transposase